MADKLTTAAQKQKKKRKKMEVSTPSPEMQVSTWNAGEYHP